MKNEDINKEDLTTWMRKTEVMYATRSNKKITVTLSGIFYIYKCVNEQWGIIGATVNIEDAISEFNNL